MIFSEPLSQYEEILKDAIRTSMKESGAKLAKTFQTLLIEILTLYMILPRKINFTQMARYGKHGEQTYRQNFNRRKKDCIDWFLLNLSLARRVLDMDGLLAIAIDPCYISKAGKKTPHIGRFWSGCAGAVKHGLEIMGIGLQDVANNKCMMLRAHQTIGNSTLNIRNMRTFYEYWMQYIICSPMASKLQIAVNKDVIDIDNFSLQKWSPMASEIPREEFFGISFSHHMEILHKTKDLHEILFYIPQTVLHKWDKYDLRDCLKEGLYQKHGVAANNFLQTMPVNDARKAVGMFKDEYLLDYINIDEMEVAVYEVSVL